MNQDDLTIQSPLMTNSEAMAFFRIKDPRVWRRYQNQHKIPFEFIGKKKFFHKDLLNKVAKTAQEKTARKVYA